LILWEREDKLSRSPIAVANPYISPLCFDFTLADRLEVQNAVYAVMSCFHIFYILSGLWGTYL